MTKLETYYHALSESSQLMIAIQDLNKESPKDFKITTALNHAESIYLILTSLGKDPKIQRLKEQQND